MFAGCKRLPFKERNSFIKNVTVSRHLHIVAHAIREPHGVIGNPRSDAHAGGGKPPMLEIPFDKLPGGSAQDMFARNGRARGEERHRILQLIAETIGPAGLVEA